MLSEITKRKDQTTNQALIRRVLIEVITMEYIRVNLKKCLSNQNETDINRTFYKNLNFILCKMYYYLKEFWRELSPKTRLLNI